MKKITLSTITMLCMVLICPMWANSQTWMSKFDVTPQLPGGWQEVSKIIKTASNDYLAIGYGTSGMNSPVVVGKFDAAGNAIWTQSYTWTTLTYYALKGLDIAEGPNGDIAIAGSVTPYLGTEQNWIVKLNSSGVPQWEDHWIGYQITSLIFTHDPLNNNFIVAAATDPFGSVTQMGLHIINPASGAVVRSGIISVGVNPEQTMDIVEDQARGGYWILVNHQTVMGPQTFVRFIDYAITSNAGRTFLISGGNQACSGVQLALDNNHLYVLGNVINTTSGAPRAERPTLFDLDIPSSTVTTRTLLDGSIPGSIPAYSTDLVLTEKTGSEGILVTGFTTINGIMQPWLWSTDRLLNTTGFYDHSNPTQPGGVKYVSTCLGPTSDHCMVTGRDGSPNNLILSKVTYDGQVLCSLPLVYTEEQPTVLIVNSVDIDIPFVTPMHNNSPSISFSWQPDPFCACQQPAAKNYFIYAVNGTYDPNGWNGGDYHFGSGESYLFVTDQSTPNSTAQLFSIASNGQRNFVKEYSSPLGPLMGSDIKRTANGDFIMAGFVLSTNRLYIMRTDNAGNIIWSLYYPTGRTAGSPRIAEAVNGDIVLVAATDITTSGASTQNLLQIRLNSAGGQLYYRDQNMQVGGVTRHYFQVTGITPTADDGYAVSGTTGHNWDYFAAYVFKFDQTSITGVRDWEYEFLAQTLTNCYSLGTPGCRAYAVFYDVKEIGHDLIAVGFTSDHSQYGSGATYVDGLLVKLNSSNGALIGLKQYADANAQSETIFHGVNKLTGGQKYLVTGYIKDISTGTLKHLFTQINATTLNVTGIPFFYGTGNIDLGFRVHEGNNSNFVMMGVGDDNGSMLPTITSVDPNGKLGCERPYTITETVPAYRAATIDITSPLKENPDQLSLTVADPCREFLDFCSSSNIVSRHTGTTDLSSSIQNAPFAVYPNPAGSHISIPLNSKADTHVTARLYEMQGRMIMEYKTRLDAGQALNNIDISGLKNGIYLIRIADEHNTVYPTLKFVKN